MASCVIVLGIDPGLTADNPCGFAVIDAGVTPRLIHWQQHAPNASRWDARIPILVAVAQHIILTHQPVLVAYELPWVGVNQQTAIKLALLDGAMLGVAALYSIPALWATPSQAKHALTGNGAATKDEMIAAVLHRFQRRLPKDPADAVGTALAGAGLYQLQHLAPKGSKLP